MVHMNPVALNPEHIVDLVSIFFMGLLFAYIVLKTGSLLPAVIFHYVHDIFVLLVQNTPEADKILSAMLLYSFLWSALTVGAILAKYIVERWPTAGLEISSSQA